MLQHIFDKETCIFLENIMLKDDDYCSKNYIFNFDSPMVVYVQETLDHYLDSITSWGKPALLLFGSNDRVTRKTLSYYRKKKISNNIKIKEIQNTSHITPCMDTRYQLSKLQPVVDFYKDIPLQAKTLYVR